MLLLLLLLRHKAKKLTPNALRTKEDMPTSRGGGAPQTWHTNILKVTKTM